MHMNTHTCVLDNTFTPDSFNCSVTVPEIIASKLRKTCNIILHCTILTVISHSKLQSVDLRQLYNCEVFQNYIS